MTEKDISEKEEQILQESEENRLAEGALKQDEEQVKIIIFSLHNALYAFYGEFAKEILTVNKISYVPGAPNYILGIINVRGDIESVLDVTSFLGLPPIERTARARISLMKKDGVQSGVLLGAVEDVLDVSKRCIQPPVSTFDDSVKGFILGETEYKGQNVTLIDIGAIFKKISTVVEASE